MTIKKLNQKGIGLVEVIAALGIALMTITALVSLALYTMRTSLQSKLTLEGSKLASREIELVRAMRDRSDTWSNFVAGISLQGCVVNPGSGSCHMDPTTLFPVTGDGTVNVDNQNVTRRFTADLSETDPNVVYITVTVSWNIAGRQHQSNLYTYLTNWRNE